MATVPDGPTCPDSGRSTYSQLLPSFTPTHTRSHAYTRSHRVCMGMGDREKEVSNTFILCGTVKEGRKSGTVFFRIIRCASFPSFTVDSFTTSFSLLAHFGPDFTRRCVRRGRTCFTVDGSFPEQPAVDSRPAGCLDRLDLDVALLDQCIDHPLKCF